MPGGPPTAGVGGSATVRFRASRVRWQTFGLPPGLASRHRADETTEGPVSSLGSSTIFEALGIIGDRFSLSGEFWTLVAICNERLGAIGFLIIAVFSP